MLKISNNIIETLLGAFVILIAAYFAYFAYSSGQEGRSFKGYLLQAKFERIDGLHVGSDVKISGVKIGSIKSLEIDSKTFQANVIFYIDDKLKLPTDSRAAVVSESLLGGKYVTLEPGVDSDVLENKGIISETESSVNFETLLNKFLFSKPEDTDSTKKKNVNTDHVKSKPHKKSGKKGNHKVDEEGHKKRDNKQNHNKNKEDASDTDESDEQEQEESTQVNE